MIAWNGRGFRESEVPKYREYWKHWAIESAFSRLKETFGLSRNRFAGMKKVAMRVF